MTDGYSVEAAQRLFLEMCEAERRRPGGAALYLAYASRHGDPAIRSAAAAVGYQAYHEPYPLRPDPPLRPPITPPPPRPDPPPPPPPPPPPSPAEPIL